MIFNYRKILYTLLLAVVFAGIGVFIYNNLEDLKATSVSFNWNFILIGLLLTLLAHLSSYAIWTRIATSFEMSTRWSHSGKAWFLSRLGRYVPGKISILLLRFNAYDAHSKTKVSTATVIEAYTTLCAATILLFLFAITSSSSAAPSIFITTFALLTILLVAHPRVTQLALRSARKLFPIPKLHSLPNQGEMLRFSCAQLLAMLLHGGALFMAFNAIGYAEPEHYFLITAALFVAGLIGMMAVFAPSGIGVREAALIAMLAEYLDATTLIYGVVLIRLIGIGSEIILSAFFITYERFVCAANS